ncbi:MAG: MATE family efflux transporter, partial [Clostridiales bacterium]|nr:MATE family efflux transporter [Clostridiales bacterium]
MEKSERKRKKLSLTEGSLFKNIILFSLPLMLSNLLQVLFNMSDVAVVGRFAGAAALGAVGSTSILVMLFTGFAIGIGSGVNSLIARHIGAGDDEEVASAFRASAVVSLAVGIVAAALGIGLSEPLLSLLQTKPEFIDGAVLYVRIYFCGMPALAVYNLGNGVFSADGDTKRPLIFMSIAGVVNILLNLLFVIVCDMSVVGVALASIISQYLSAALIVAALMRTKRPYRLRFRQFKISGDKVKRVLMLGIPAGFQNAIFSAANLFIQAGVNSFDAVMVEGNSAASNADAIIYDLMAAFYTACTSFMSQNFGAGKNDRILKSYFVCLLYSFGIGAIMGGVLLLGGRYFLALCTT